MSPEMQARQMISIAKSGIEWAGIDERILVPNIASRIAELEGDLSNTLRAVLHHFGPEGAHKVTETAIALRSEQTKGA